MADYSIDRARLEALPTEEIQRILKEERDDYTTEALEIFREILEERGVGRRDVEAGQQGQSVKRGGLSLVGSSQDLLVSSPKDGVVILNRLLKGLLDGSMEPQVVQVGSQVIMNILRAMEQEFLTDSEEES